MRRPYSRLAAACALAVAAAICSGSALAGNPNAPGQEKKDDTATQQQVPAQQAPAEQQQPAEQQAPPGQAKKQEQQPAPPPQAGVKPDSTTTHWTHCTTGHVGMTATCAAQAGTPNVGPDVSKRYGNGKTAAQIAVGRGAPDGTLITGPGNSQPHKVSDCRHKANKSGGVDVHAIKSYAASCGEQAARQPQQQAAVAVSTCSLGMVAMANGQCGAPAASEEHATAAPALAQPTAAPQTPAPVVQVAAPPATQGAASVAPTAAPAATPARGGVLGAQTTLGSPTSQGGVLGTAGAVAGRTLPFTGFPLWIAVLAAAGLLGAGIVLRRRVRPARL